MIIRHIYLFLALCGLVLLPLKINSLIAPEFDGQLRLYNTHSQETLEIRYLDEAGQPLPQALEKISEFLRCPATGKSHEMDLQLLKALDRIQDHFGATKTLSVISGYRSPEYNAELKARGRGVATHSQHIQGKACDFKIDDVPLETLRDFALKIKAGGVGYYPGLWVHLDSAVFRTW